MSPWLQEVVPLSQLGEAVFWMVLPSGGGGEVDCNLGFRAGFCHSFSPQTFVQGSGCRPPAGIVIVKEEWNPDSVQLADPQTHHYLAAPLDD